MRTDPNIPDADGFYEALIAAQEGLSEAEAEAFLLRLMLLLANQVGDQQALLDAIAATRAMVARKAHG
ncbi:MAG TPA: DUF2783 domain-containing protein [Stellaceae bacterium]|nr:DUF2783 domain-containing protein [Stellaceae bacterium]